MSFDMSNMPSGIGDEAQQVAGIAVNSHRLEGSALAALLLSTQDILDHQSSAGFDSKTNWDRSVLSMDEETPTGQDPFTQQADQEPPLSMNASEIAREEQLEQDAFDTLPFHGHASSACAAVPIAETFEFVSNCDTQGALETLPFEGPPVSVCLPPQVTKTIEFHTNGGNQEALETLPFDGPPVSACLPPQATKTIEFHTNGGTQDGLDTLPYRGLLGAHDAASMLASSGSRLMDDCTLPYGAAAHAPDRSEPSVVKGGSNRLIDALAETDSTLRYDTLMVNAAMSVDHVQSGDSSTLDYRADLGRDKDPICEESVLLIPNDDAASLEPIATPAEKCAWNLHASLDAAADVSTLPYEPCIVGSSKSSSSSMTPQKVSKSNKMVAAAQPDETGWLLKRRKVSDVQSNVSGARQASHATAATPSMSAFMTRRGCAKGCGLTAFGRFPTCCTRCQGPNGPHAADCKIKNVKIEQQVSPEGAANTSGIAGLGLQTSGAKSGDRVVRPIATTRHDRLRLTSRHPQPRQLTLQESFGGCSGGTPATPVG